MKLREADQAFRDGQLSEAAQRIEQEQLQNYLPGKRLANKVAQAMTTRAMECFENGDTAGAWSYWDRANNFVGETKAVVLAQQKMIDASVQLAERELSGAAPLQVLGRLEHLRQRKLGGELRARLEEVARRLESARNLARAGRFVDAREQLSFAGSLRPDLQAIAAAKSDNEKKHRQCSRLDQRLHEALKAESWTESLEIANQLLELAPEHKAARHAQKRAWAEVGAASRAPSANSVIAMADRQMRQNNHSEPAAAEITHDGGTLVSDEHPERFLLWIDAVGGYLVCLSPEIVIGQAGGAGVDIPLLADISRRHAKIRREGDAYLLEPLSPVLVEGKMAAGPQELLDGDELDLGSVRLRFRRPHPLSCSAKLEFVSKHRTQPTADAVLLMAESCVLGPGPQSHVVCRDFSDDVVLFQRDKKLHCRCMFPVEVDGKRCDGVSVLGAESHISGEDFSLSLEPC